MIACVMFKIYTNKQLIDFGTVYRHDLLAIMEIVIDKIPIELIENTKYFDKQNNIKMWEKDKEKINIINNIYKSMFSYLHNRNDIRHVNFITLIKDMFEYDYNKRISINQVYESVSQI